MKIEALEGCFGEPSNNTSPLYHGAVEWLTAIPRLDGCGEAACGRDATTLAECACVQREIRWSLLREEGDYGRELLCAGFPIGGRFGSCFIGMSLMRGVVVRSSKAQGDMRVMLEAPEVYVIGNGWQTVDTHLWVFTDRFVEGPGCMLHPARDVHDIRYGDTLFALIEPSVYIQHGDRRFDVGTWCFVHRDFYYLTSELEIRTVRRGYVERSEVPVLFRIEGGRIRGLDNRHRRQWEQAHVGRRFSEWEKGGRSGYWL